MAKVFIDGQVVYEIDWNKERFQGSAIHAVGKCLFHATAFWAGRHRASDYAIALASILGYPDYEAVQIGDAFGDLELKPRSKS